MFNFAKYIKRKNDGNSNIYKDIINSNSFNINSISSNGNNNAYQKKW